MARLHARGIELFNDPGSLTENAYIESLNGKFRDKCLNEQWFESLRQVRQEITHWRLDYNHTRPHYGIGRIPSTQFAVQHRQRAGGVASRQDVK